MSTVKWLYLPRQSYWTLSCDQYRVAERLPYTFDSSLLTQPSDRHSCSALGHGGAGAGGTLRTCCVSGTGLGVFPSSFLTTGLQRRHHDSQYTWRLNNTKDLAQD